MLKIVSDKPGAQQRRPWNPQPGRLNPGATNTRDRLQFAATQAKLRTLQADWLWNTVGPEGRRRLLQEHGLIER